MLSWISYAMNKINQVEQKLNGKCHKTVLAQWMDYKEQPYNLKIQYAKGEWIKGGHTKQLSHNAFNGACHLTTISSIL